jgi:hypothetical protein
VQPSAPSAIKTRTRSILTSLSSSREQHSEPEVPIDSAGNKDTQCALLLERSSSREQDSEINGLIDALRTRTRSAAHQTITNAAESEIGPIIDILDRTKVSGTVIDFLNNGVKYRTTVSGTVIDIPNNGVRYRY